MKRMRASIALIAAGALLALSGVRAAPDAANQAQWESGRPAALGTVSAGDPSLLESPNGAGEAEDVEAMNQLGVLHLLNAKTSSDFLMATHWFQRAIDNGSVDAMHNLARMYLHGVGMPRDYANAFGWFRRAALGGCAHSMHVLAVMAENGLGTPRDLPLARAMYREAAASGIAPAMLWVSDDLARGAGAGRNLVEAYAWLHVAAPLVLDEQRQIEMMARMEELATRLGPVRRDEARARAARIVAAIRERLLLAEPDLRTPIQPSPQPAGQSGAIRMTQARP
jgi:TPR repeat protein